MSDSLAVTGNNPGGWILRGTERSLAKLRYRAALQAEAYAARAEALAYVARKAMFETALLTQTEQGLATLVPLAASRLQAIGDAATLAIVGIVGDAGRGVV